MKTNGAWEWGSSPSTHRCCLFSKRGNVSRFKVAATRPTAATMGEQPMSGEFRRRACVATSPLSCHPPGQCADDCGPPPPLGTLRRANWKPPSRCVLNELVILCVRMYCSASRDCCARQTVCLTKRRTTHDSGPLQWGTPSHSNNNPSRDKQADKADRPTIQLNYKLGQ